MFLLFWRDVAAPIPFLVPTIAATWVILAAAARFCNSVRRPTDTAPDGRTGSTVLTTTKTAESPEVPPSVQRLAKMAATPREALAATAPLSRHVPWMRRAALDGSTEPTALSLMKSATLGMAKPTAQLFARMNAAYRVPQNVKIHLS